ncbi:TPA: phage tail tape measure protein [Listeria innocua]|uniref:phage tail tape measure protein n=1 Tax=Listeria innocua TaxID=1642 RepID=UPI002995D63F|nr:phage tail tape measure protein [Listeria innocua]HBM3493438.1 phage tail tape measure protein [Listeria innocua]HBM3614117.1 phage tail tape measure protein [Listeria innocua]HBM3635854.1 phage tail tape measure protein [Listeria innocua]HBM3801114.1 phage tail tape measure protein [Listeria innocua]HBM4163503.1 phage tail tape measure protein [Listeria innocua]
MASNQPKITFKVFNQDFNSAMSQMNAESKKFRQELKLEQEQLKNTGSETDKLTADLNGLQKQYDVASQKTKETAQQLEKVKTQFGENSTEANKMETALKSAQITEQQLANKIELTTDALEKAKSAESGRVASLNKLQSEQSNLEAQSAKLASEYKLESAAMEGTATEAEKLARAEKYLADQTDVAEQKIKNMEQQLELVKQEYGENSTEALKMETSLNEAKTSVSRLGDELTEFKGDSNNAGQGMDELNNKLSGAVMMEAAEQIAAVGEKLKEIGQYALEAFREVDDGLDTIITKTGATGKAGEDLSKVFYNIFGDTIFESQEVGDAIGEVNTQFGQTDKKLEETSLLFLKFANINNTDVTTSVMSAKRAIEAYGLVNKDIPMILDATTSASQKTGKSTEELMEMAVDAAPQFDSLNISYKDGVLLLGQLSQSGLDSSKTMKALNKATGYYAKENKTLAQGLGELQSKIKNASTEQEGINAATEVFGTKTGPLMARAVKSNVINLGDLAKTSEESGGTVSKTFEATLDPIDRQDVALNNVKMAMGDLGNSIAEVLAPILDVLSSLLQKVSSWFNSLPAPIRQVTVIIGLLIIGFTALLPVVTAVVAMVGILGTAMLPIIGIIAGIVAGIAVLVVGFKWLWDNCEGFRNFWIGLWEGIVAAFQSAWEYIQPGIQAIADALKKFWEEYGPTIIGALQAVWNYIVDFIAWLEPVWTFLWEGLKSTLKFAWDAILVVVQFALDYLGGLIDFWAGIFTGDWDRVWKGIQKMTSAVWEAIKGIFFAAVKWVDRTLKSLGIDIGAIWKSITDATKSAWKWIGDHIINPIRDAYNRAKAILAIFKAAFKIAFDSIKENISNAWSKVEDKIIKPISNAYNKVKNILGDIKDTFKNLKLKFPKIDMPKLPHFSLKGKFSLKEMTVPKLDVSWHKNGGFFNSASVIGIGEAGPEAAVPLVGNRMDPFADAVSNRMLSSLPQMAQGKISENNNDVKVEINMNNNLYGSADEDRLVNKVKREITNGMNSKTTAWGGRSS